MKKLLFVATLVMLGLGHEIRGAELPPSDFLVGRASSSMPPSDFLVKSDIPPRPEGPGWNWDADRKCWWRWMAPVAPLAPVPVNLGIMAQQFGAVCGPNGCNSAVNPRRYLRR